MRARTWVLLASLVLGLGLGFLGRGTDVEAFLLLSGLAWLTAIAVALSLLPFWGRVLPEVPPMTGLFDAVPEGDRWCTSCGSPTRDGPCSVCGAAPRARKT